MAVESYASIIRDWAVETAQQLFMGETPKTTLPYLQDRNLPAQVKKFLSPRRRTSILSVRFPIASKNFTNH
jgi:hypothetical protein